LLHMQLESDVAQLEAMFQDQEIYLHKRVAAANWSRHYTLDRFEDEIKRMLRDA